MGKFPGGGVFAIGDIHGCNDELRELLKKLPLTRDSLVVVLGDTIDRGPSSREVIDTLLELQDYCNVVTLIGNHELMLREFLDGSDPRLVARFVYNGGGATLASYADADGNVWMPPEHREFFDNLAWYHVEGEYCFVHAGLPVGLDELDIARHGEEMVWMRRRPDIVCDKIIVHGHTPRSEIELGERSINLDTACVYGGRLTAMEVYSRRAWFVERDPRVEPVHLRDGRDSRRGARRFTGRIPVAVRAKGRTYDFETINYSEIGMLMRGVGPAAHVRLEPGTTISGRIGAGHGETPFHGVILRIDGDNRHAVKLLPEP
jgi:serine/threonine protein phosphatase 1